MVMREGKARVWVNRQWERLFGTGLVKTSENLGSQAEYPSHPDLLDWLAFEFLESGRDMKRMIREIVTSAAYLQSATVTPDALAADPENRLLARSPRIRLPGEFVRAADDDDQSGCRPACRSSCGSPTSRSTCFALLMAGAGIKPGLTDVHGEVVKGILG